jgi:hypothetical protein
MRLPSKKCASVIQLVTFARLIVPTPDHHRAWRIPAPQPRREPVRPSISCSTSIIIMPTGTSNAPCIVLFTVNVKERVGMLMTRTFGYLGRNRRLAEALPDHVGNCVNAGGYDRDHLPPLPSLRRIGFR